jgi:hypothetical protein
MCAQKLGLYEIYWEGGGRRVAFLDWMLDMMWGRRGKK